MLQLRIGETWQSVFRRTIGVCDELRPGEHAPSTRRFQNSVNLIVSAHPSIRHIFPRPRIISITPPSFRIILQEPPEGVRTGTEVRKHLVGTCTNGSVHNSSVSRNQHRRPSRHAWIQSFYKIEYKQGRICQTTVRNLPVTPVAQDWLRCTVTKMARLEKGDMYSGGQLEHSHVRFAKCSWDFC